jgi:hypothetical protein
MGYFIKYALNCDFPNQLLDFKKNYDPKRCCIIL